MHYLIPRKFLREIQGVFSIPFQTKKERLREVNRSFQSDSASTYLKELDKDLSYVIKTIV